MLAEPMVDDFGRCFAGVTPDQAEELADSFALGACVRRERLLEVIRQSRSWAAATS